MRFQEEADGIVAQCIGILTDASSKKKHMDTFRRTHTEEGWMTIWKEDCGATAREGGGRERKKERVKEKERDAGNTLHS